MKRTYTIPYKIPKGTATLTPQGLRGIYEESTGSKRAREFNVEILSDKVPESTCSNDKLESRLIESVGCLFTQPDLEWLSKYHHEATRVRNLFLYERDNANVWEKIETLLTDFIKGLASETLDVELGSLLPTIDCVDKSVKSKFALFYDYFYWFNPVVKLLYGSPDVLEYLQQVYGRVYSQNPAIVTRIEEALLSLHNQGLDGSSPETFGFWLDRCCEITGEKVLMGRLLQLITDWSMGQLISDALNIEEWINNFKLWKQAEKILWDGINLDSIQNTVKPTLKKLETLMLIQGLKLHEEQLVLVLLDKPEIINEITQLVEQDPEAMLVFQEICGGLVPRYYQCVCELNLKPIVSATLICDLSEITIAGELGKKDLFQPSWRKFLKENAMAAKPLSQLAAESMNEQNYEYVSKVARLLELDGTSGNRDNASPFSETFSESLWAEICELSCKQTGKSRTNRFTHGINILRDKAPLVGWHASVFLGLLDEQPAINQVYWHKEVKHEANVAETKRMTQEYVQKYPNRLVQWDLAHSIAEVQLNGQIITCTFPAFQILDLLAKTSGHGIPLSSLQIPQSMLDTTLKELISGQYIAYVPSSKARKFEDEDMIYLTYK